MIMKQREKEKERRAILCRRESLRGFWLNPISLSLLCLKQANIAGRSRCRIGNGGSQGGFP